MENDVLRGAFANRGCAEKARRHGRRCCVERPGGISPTDVATILPAQHTIDGDVVQAAAKELDLLQKILYQVCEQASEIVALAANRGGAFGVARCLCRRHG